MSLKTRIVSFASVVAVGAVLGACATEQPVTTGKWNYTGEDAVASTKPLMRLAALPVNPAPNPPYADYTDEPTRFLFHPRIIIIDDETGLVEDTSAMGDMFDDSGE